MSTVSISKPENASTGAIVRPEPGQGVAFQFDPSAATFERSGNDLAISFEGKGSVVVNDFFVTEGQGALRALVLQDGSEVNSADFLRAMNPDIDVDTAAGPSAATQSSGAGDYADNGGDLLGGVDRMGRLGSSQWSSEREAVSLAEPTVYDLGTAAALAATDPIQKDDSVAYDARAVLYAGGRHAPGTAMVSVPALYPGADGKPAPISGDAYDVTVTAAGNWDQSWIASVDLNPATGRWDIVLSPEGLSALQNAEGGRLTPPPLLTFSVSGEGGASFEYTMQVVVTSDRTFNSWEQNQEDGLAGDVLYGEWHSGHGGANANGAYEIVSSAGNDEIVVNDMFANGGSIYASRQDGYDPDDPATWIGGNDSNTIDLRGGMLADNGATNLVDSSNGVINVSGPDSGWDDVYAMWADGGGAVNTIAGHQGKVTVKGLADPFNNKGVALHAEDGGENRIVSADVDARAEGRLAYGLSADNGLNSVTASGRIEAHADGQWATAMYATGGGRNELDNTGDASRGILLDAQSAGTSAIALNAAKSSANPAGSVNSVKSSGLVEVLVTGTGNANSRGLQAGVDSRNEITESGAVDMSVTAKQGQALGMQAAGGVNSVASSGLIDLEVISENNAAWGLYASAGTNTLTGDDAVNLQVTAKNAATGMQSSRGLNTISADGQVEVHVESTAGNAYGMKVSENGANEIAQSGGVLVDVNAGAEKEAYGLHTSNSAQSTGPLNTITSDGAVEVLVGEADSRSDTAVGLQSGGGGNAVASSAALDGAVSIEAYGGNDAWGLNADRGTNLVTATGTGGGVSVVADASGWWGIGLRSAGGDNVIKADGQVTVQATADYAAHGLEAASGGTNSITAGGLIEVTAQGGDLSYGVKTDVGSTTSLISKAGGITVSATVPETDDPDDDADKSSFGLYAAKDSLNTLEAAQDIRVTAQGSDHGWGGSSGVYSIGSSGLSSSAGSITVTATASDDAYTSYGVIAAYSLSAENTLKAARDITIGAYNGGVITAALSSVANAAGNTLQAGGTVKLESSGDLWSYGMYAVSGENLIDSAAKAIVNAGNQDALKDPAQHGTSVEASGLYAGGGINRISAVSGEEGVIVTAVGGTPEGHYRSTKWTSTGLRAEKDGQNIIGDEDGVRYSDVGKVEINAHAVGYSYTTSNPYSSARALGANVGGGNIITANEITLGADGLKAAYGVDATGGVNTINVGESLSIRTEAGFASHALYATTDGVNTVNAAEGASVRLEAVTDSSSGSASGLHASYDGSNSINADKVTIDLTGNSGLGLGLQASGGSNSITASGSVDLQIAGGSAAWGLYASSQGDNTIAASGQVKVHIADADRAGQAIGLQVNDGANAVSSSAALDEAVSINAYGVDTALGLSASKGTNTVTATGEGGGVKVVADASGMWGVGLQAKGGSNRIEAEGQVAVEATAAGIAHGLEATTDGDNVIEAEGQVTVKASSSSFMARGLTADSGGKNIVSGGQVTVEATKAGMISIGLEAAAGGENSIASEGQVTVKAAGAGAVAGLEAGGGGENSIAAGGQILVEAHSTGSFAKGLSNFASRNIVEGGSVKITAEGGYKVLGVVAEELAEKSDAFGNWITSTEGDMEIEVLSREDGSMVGGVWAGDSTDGASVGSNYLESANGIRITVQGDNEVKGIIAKNIGSENLITAGEVELTASSANGNAYGMHAFFGGANTIESHVEEAITVTILVEAGQGKGLYAMYAGTLLNDTGGANAIIGHSTEGASDVITLTGDLHAVRGGTNSIQTGAGDDVVRITGDITGADSGKNIINTGEGDDVVRITGDITGAGANIINTDEGDDIVHLHGKVGDGSLALNMGTGGYDTLVLTASSVEEFKEFYDTWLKAGFADADVEAVHIGITNPEGNNVYEALQEYFTESGLFADIDVTYSLGDTLYLDQMRASDSGEPLNFHDLLDDYGLEGPEDGRLELKLGGERANALLIDADELSANDIKALQINGDGDDSIMLSGGWTEGASETVGYTSYSLGDITIDIANDINIINNYTPDSLL